MRLSVRMLLSRHGHVLIDIKLIYSVNYFKIPPLGVSGPKNDIISKPEVSHKKVKIDVFALDIEFKLGLWVHITPLTDFAPRKVQKQTGSAPRNSKNT